MHLKATIFIALATLCLSSWNAHAEDELAVFEQQITDVIGVLVTTSTLMTNASEIGPGQATLEFPGGEDVVFKGFQLPWRKQIATAGKGQLRLHGFTAYSTSTEYLTLDNATNKDRSKTTLYSIGFGLSYKTKLSDHWTIWPKAIVSFQHFDNKYQYSSEYTQLLRPLFEGRIANWEFDSYTINPSVEAEYTSTYGEYTSTLSSKISLNHIQTTNLNTKIHDVTLNGNFWSTRYRLGRAYNISISPHPIYLEGSLSRTQLYGDGDDALRTSYIHKIGGRIGISSLRKFRLIQSLSIDLSLSEGVDFKGYSIGFSFNQ